MIPVHEYFREHSKTYYRWHTIGFVNAFHWLLLALFIFGAIAGAYLYGAPRAQRAAAAVSMTALTSGSAGPGVTTCTSASITPSSDALVLLWVESRVGFGAASTPTVTGNSLTWTQVASVGFNTTSTTASRLTLFKALGSSPTTGTVAMNFGLTQGNCIWSIVEYSGVDTTTPVVQSQTNNANSASSLTVTLSSFGSSSNVTAAGFGADLNVAIDNEGTWTEIHDIGTTVGPGPSRLENQWYNGNDTTATGTMNSGTADMAGIAVEIAASSSPTTMTFSGTCKQSNRSTNCTDSETVKLAVGSTLNANTGTTSSGTWSITVDVTDVTWGTDQLTFFIDGVADSNRANAVVDTNTTYNTSQYKSIKLVEGALTAGTVDEYSYYGTVTNSEMGNYDNAVSSDADVFFDVDASNNLSVDSGAKNLLVDGNYRPDSSGGISVTANDYIIDASITADSNTFYVGGDWDNNLTFTAGTSTVVFNGGGSNAIDSTGAVDYDFYNLTIGQSGSTSAASLSTALVVSNDLGISYGSLSMNGAHAISLTGSLTIGSSGNYTKGTETFTFNGSTAEQWSDARTTKADLGTVTISGTSLTLSIGSSVTATSININLAQTLALGSSGYTLTLTGSGTPLSVSGTLDEGSNSTVLYTGTSATTVTSETYYNLDVKPGSGTPTYTISGGGGTPGTASIIDDSGNVGALPGSARLVVRDASDNIYAFLNDGGSCELWKSADSGSSWSEQDASNNPSCSTITDHKDVSAAIDSAGIIHLIYFDAVMYEPPPIKYVTFDTSSGTFGTPATALTITGGGLIAGELALAVDSNDKPHVVVGGYSSTLPGGAQIQYANKVSGSWSSVVSSGLVSSTAAAEQVDIAINEDNIPEVAFSAPQDAGTYSTITAAVGNANNATSFTLQSVSTTAAIPIAGQGASIAVDSTGNTWVGYITESGDNVTLIKHNDTDAWSTWQTAAQSGNAGQNPTIAAVGDTLYIFYENDTNDISYDSYNGSWAGEAIVATGTYQDVHVRWSEYNNNSPTALDFLYSDGTDVWWNVLGGSGGTGTLAANNMTIGDGTNAVTFDNASSNVDVDVGGTFTIAANATYSASATAAMNLAGTYANSGTFTHSSGTVTLDGTSTQSITCGSSSFNTLTSTNTSGLTFSGNCTTAGTFSHNQGSTTLTFEAGSTYAFNAIDIDGAAASLVTMQSSSGGSYWYFNVTAATPTVTYINVSDSNASGGSEIDASDGTSTNGGHNVNWNFTGNVGPTNDSLTFTNPYGGSGNTAVADDTVEWTFQAKVTDTNGLTDIDYVELRLANNTDSSLPYSSLVYKWDRATDVFSEVADTQAAATITSTSADSTSSGNQWTLDFKLQINGNFATKDISYSGELYSIDMSAASDDDNYLALYQVTDLSLTLLLDSSTVAFGSLSPLSEITDTTVATVTTNYPNGYSLSAHDSVPSSWSALLHTDSTTRIADYTGTITTPTLWSGSGLGICVYAATDKEAKWGTGTIETDSNNKYAGVPETATIIHTKTGSPTASDVTDIGYKLVVPIDQKTGSYSGDITYTATGVLN